METDSIKIRQASREDVELIVELSTKTFFDTYGHEHSKEDMDAYLISAFSKEKILEELCNDNIVFLIAYKDKPVAYLQLTPARKPPSIKECSSIELKRIYVSREMTGRKIGSELIKESLEIANSRNYKMIWLAVWEFNPLAIAFYERFGFKPFGSDIFTLGETKRNLILMKKELINSDSLP